MFKHDFTPARGISCEARLCCRSTTEVVRLGKTPTTTLRRHFSRVYWRSLFAFIVVVASALGGRFVDAGEATGGGLWVREFPVVGNEEVEYLGISAIENGGGTHGSLVFQLKIDGVTVVRSYLTVDCLLYLDESTVIVGTTVVNDTDPEYIGTTAVVVLRDNGEGVNAPADERSTVYYSLDLGFVINCEVGAALIMDDPSLLDNILAPIDTGNFQVSP